MLVRGQWWWRGVLPVYVSQGLVKLPGDGEEERVAGGWRGSVGRVARGRGVGGSPRLAFLGVGLLLEARFIKSAVRDGDEGGVFGEEEF